MFSPTSSASRYISSSNLVGTFTQYSASSPLAYQIFLFARATHISMNLTGFSFLIFHIAFKNGSTSLSLVLVRISLFWKYLITSMWIFLLIFLIFVLTGVSISDVNCFTLHRTVLSVFVLLISLSTLCFSDLLFSLSVSISTLLTSSTAFFILFFALFSHFSFASFLNSSTSFCHFSSSLHNSTSISISQISPRFFSASLCFMLFCHPSHSIRFLTSLSTALLKSLLALSHRFLGNLISSCSVTFFHSSSVNQYLCLISLSVKNGYFSSHCISMSL